MVRFLTNTADCLAGGKLSTEADFSWPGGSIHLRSLSAQQGGECDLTRTDVAVGICFHSPGSAVQWQLDGKLVLNKVPTSSGFSRELIILPAGHDLLVRCRGEGELLWLVVDRRSINHDSRIDAFVQCPKIDGSWGRNRLSWALATQLRQECRSGFRRGATFLHAASMTLLAELACFFEKAAPATGRVDALSEPKLASVLAYITRHLEHNVTLAELAGLVNLTPRYFCQVFKRAVGCPPHQFQIQQRIERAKFLLREPLVPLSDVALRSGFSSQSHLNTHFRRLLGTTPGRYRTQALLSIRPPEAGGRHASLSAGRELISRTL
jgi:AraC family transcriptional regulator